MNNPELVRVAMAEICDMMSNKNMCIELCWNCPLNDANPFKVNLMTEMLDKEL